MFASNDNAPQVEQQEPTIVRRRLSAPDYSQSPAGLFDHVLAFLIGFALGFVILFVYYRVTILSIIGGIIFGVIYIFIAA